MSTRNLAIMFTDILGFTARVSASKREEVTRLRELHERLLPPVFRHFDGTVIKTIGDAFLVRFDSPTDAVLCGLSIQEVLRRHNATARESDRLEVRVALNAGEVELTKNDVYGETVNIAARVEAIAEAGEVFFTEAVYLAMNRREVPSAEVGEHTFKGIPYPVRIYKARQEENTTVRQRVAGSIELTERGPVIRGLRVPANVGGPLRRYGVAIAAGSVLLTVVALLLLRPTEEERALEEARSAMSEGRFRDALERLDGPLRDDPSSSDLRSAALSAATSQLERVTASDGASGALAWLRGQIETRPWLDDLRDRIPRLDAEATAQVIRTAENPWPPLREFVERRKDDGDALAHAGFALVDMPFRQPGLALLTAAQTRGAFAGSKERRDRLLGVMGETFRVAGWGSETMQIAMKLVVDALGEEAARAWARDRLVSATSGRVLENAWRLLRDLEDPLADDAFYVDLVEMTDGFRDAAHADRSLATFRNETDEARRRQILAIHRWVVDPDVSWGGSHRKLVGRNLGELEGAWR